MNTLTITSYKHPGVQGDSGHDELLTKTLRIPSGAKGSVDAGGNYKCPVDFSLVTALRLATGTGNVPKVLTVTKNEPHGITTQTINVGPPAMLTIDAIALNAAGDPCGLYQHVVPLMETMKLEVA